MGKKRFIGMALVAVLLLVASVSDATIKNRSVHKKADIDLGKINIEADPNEHRAASDGYNQFIQLPTVTNANQITPGSGFNGAIYYDSSDNILYGVIGGSAVDLGGSAATVYSSIGDPTAAGSISFDATETATYSSAHTANDFMTIVSTAAFADYSVLVLQQSGAPTDGTMLEIILADTSPDALSVVTSGTEEVNIDSSGNIVLSGGNITLTAGTLYSTSLAAGAAGDTGILIDASGSGVITFGQESTGDAIFTNDVQLNEDVDLGDASGDNITFTGTVISNITLDDGVTDSPSIILTDQVSESATITKANSGDLTVTVVAADSLRIVTGNLEVGAGSPGSIALDGENAYFAGDVEIDGTLYLETFSVATATTFASTVNIDDDVDIDLIAADQVHISTTDVASGTAGLVVIDDNRTGTNNDVVAEAALVVDSTGTFGASFVDGRVAFATGADLDINTSIDYDTAVDGELINIAGHGDAGIDLVTITRANDGAEADNGNVLVIDDNRTGTEADVAAEAALVVDSTGTYGAFFLDGNVMFAEEADIIIEETGGTDLVTVVAIAQTTSVTASIPDLGGASTFVMSTTQASAAQAVDGAFDAVSLTVDAGAGLDAQSVGTLVLGAVTADKVEIADTGVTTDVEGPLIAKEDIQSNEIDAETGVAMLIGKATATSVELGATGVTTTAKGPLTTEEAVTLGNGATDVITVTGEIAGATPLVFEGGTADDVYTTLGIDDPTLARTITLPDYAGAIPIVIYNNTATVDATGVGTTTDITGTSLTLADGWFTAGKSLKWTIYGRSDGSGGQAMALQIYIEDAAYAAVSLTTGQSDDWMAEFIVDEHTGTANQDILAVLRLATDSIALNVDTDTQAMTGATRTIKLQGTTNHAADHIYIDHIKIEHWKK